MEIIYEFGRIIILQDASDEMTKYVLNIGQYLTHKNALFDLPLAKSFTNLWDTP